ncbi:MAG: gliding motility-associated C-terminal domain-containing protein [Saprospiraceae bacterium]|nr:gliding motility-associated C-terminal domain-containing protein [Saprospiraceae bacterium]
MFRFLIIVFLFSLQIHAQTTFTVNSTNDLDDGTCNAAHCSLREAIKAAEADPMPNIIDFAIPGPGPYTIIPTGPMPSLNGDNTLINGPATAGSEVIIDFSYRVFGGATFLPINGSGNIIQNLSFIKMNFNLSDDHIISIGSAMTDALNTTIDKCNFYSDVVPGAGGVDARSILINQGTNASIKNSNFGKDLSGFIQQTNGSILVESSQGNKTFSITNNVFVTTKDCIYAKSGLGRMNDNFFGAIDTSKSPNFLDPAYGVLLENGTEYYLNRNFFFGQTVNAIFTRNLAGLVEFKDNIFHAIKKTDIELTGNSNATIGILNNRARSGDTFIHTDMTGNYALSINQNDVAEYQIFYFNVLDPSIDIAGYQGNDIRCIYNKVTSLDNTKTAKPNAPTITSIDRNQIRGTADALKTVAVYRNPNGGCANPNKVCQGGFLIGTTTADVVGNWTLNFAYIGNSSYSAYQYELGSGGKIASEFSNCYQCSIPVTERFNTEICANSSVSFRGKNYTSANPYDSIVVKGDGVICDSIFIVNIKVNNSIREIRNVNYCYNQSFNIGNISINKTNPIDSIMGNTPLGCDSTVVFIGTERGFANYSETICSNDSRTIGGQRFDINNPKGTAIIPGGSSFGCDSTINVDLTIKNFTQNNIVKTLCPGGSLIVGNETFDAGRPTGNVTFPGGSSTGCDSIVNVNLSFSNPVTNRTFTLCDGDSLLIPNTNKYLNSKKPNDTLILPNASYLQCDSFVYYKINIIQNSIGFYRQTICRTDTLTIGGQRFHAGRTQGSFQIANGAINGCDSTIQVELTVRPDAIGRLDTFTCQGSFIDIYGSIFDENRPNGTIKRSGFSTFGCDSFIMVNTSFIPLKSSTVNPTICRNGSINIGGTLFNQSNPSGNVVIRRPASQGCDSTVNVNVNFAPAITTIFSKKDLHCGFAATGEITIENVSAGGGSNIKVSIDGKGDVQYAPNLSFGSLSEGSHSIRITDGFGCDTTIVFNIEPGTALSLTLPNDTTINQGASVTILANSNFVPSTITWDPPTYLSCLDCTNPTSQPDEDITYTLTLEDENGCTIKESITIRVKIEEGDIYMPNVFSPNGDNLNDDVSPEYRFPDKTRLLVYRVFDRWGTMVFEKLDGQLGERFRWNGRFHDKELSPGVYTYAIQYESKGGSPRWKFGDITLLK